MEKSIDTAVEPTDENGKVIEPDGLDDSDNTKEIDKDHNLFECEQCGKTFTRKYYLRRHLLYHSRDLPYKCKHCGKMFRSSTTLRNHLRIHTGNMIQCEVCGKEFSVPAAWKRHMAVHRESLNVCSTCGCTFSYKTALRKHIARVHGEEITSKSKTRCKICKKRVVNLQDHLSVHSGRSYECDQCGRNFTLRRSLKRHYLLHTAKRPYTCEICDKSFVTVTCLRDHFRSHVGDKVDDIDRLLVSSHKKAKHKCTTCGRNYRTKRTMLEHDCKGKWIGNEEPSKKGLAELPSNNTTENISGDDNGLQKTAAEENSATEKGSEHEGGTATIGSGNGTVQQLDVLDANQYVTLECTQCNKTFVTRYNLRRHLMSHASGPLVKCNFCEREFLSAMSLKYHNYRMHPDKTVLENDVSISNELESDPAIGTEAVQETISQNDDFSEESMTFEKQELDIEDVHIGQTVMAENEESENDSQSKLDKLNNKQDGTHKCPECDKSFATAYNLRRHFLCHGPELPHKCNICSKAFMTSMSLKYHLLRVHNDDPNNTDPELNAEASLLNSTQEHDFCEETVKLEGEEVEIGDILILDTNGEIGVESEIVKYSEDGNDNDSNTKTTTTNSVGDILKILELDKLNSKLHSIHKCTYCVKMFATNYNLRRHLLSHAPELGHKCNVCGEAFLTATSLEYHSFIHHGNIKEKKEFRIINERKSDSATSVEKSLKSQETENQQKNGKKNVIDIDKHQAAEPSSSQANYGCDQCGMTVTSLQLLKNHSLKHSFERPHSCEICGKSFISPMSLKYHFRIHTGDQLKCQICDSEFVRAHDLKRHQIVHQEAVYDCKICNRKFKTKEKLLKHLCRTNWMAFGQSSESTSYEVLPAEEKLKHKCDVCGKSYRNSSLLKQHASIHSGDLIKCEICGKEFNVRWRWRLHMAIHRGVSETCHTCGIMFAGKAALEKHINRVHTDKIAAFQRQQEGMVKSYTCDQCGREFSQLQSLKRHSFVHSGERPHKCELCGQGFTTLTKYKYHFRDHHLGSRT